MLKKSILFSLLFAAGTLSSLAADFFPRIGAAGIRETTGAGARGAIPNATIGIGGDVRFFIDASAGTVRMRAETIQNNNTSGTSGPLRLRLLASTAAFAGTTIPGVFLADVDLGVLAAGGQIKNLDKVVPLVIPPDGTYFNAFIVEETQRGAAVTTDYFNFTGTLQAIGGKFRGLGVPYYENSPITYSGKASTPLSYAFNVYGSLDITVTAEGLPPGLKLDHALTTVDNLDPFFISGTPQSAGSFPVVLTSVNSGGTTTRNVTFNITATDGNAPPNIICATAAPTPAAPGFPVAFNAFATDPENKNVSYIWDFKDGTTGQGPNIAHTYAAAGTFDVVLTVSDGAQMSTQTLSVVVSGPANSSPLIALIAASKNPLAINESVTCTVTVADPKNLQMACVWNFGDGTPTQTGVSVSHAFAKAGVYSVSLTATNTDGFASTRSDFQLFVLSGAGDPGINPGKSAAIPEGLRIDVLSSENGIVQFGLEMVDTLGDVMPRAGNDFTSNLAIPGRTGTFLSVGNRPIGTFRKAGVAVIVANVKNINGSMIFARPARKTLAMSAKETGDAAETTDTLTADQKVLKASKLTGTFNLATEDADTVTLSCKIPIPESFDTSIPHELSVGIGNVMDRIPDAINGKIFGETERGIISALVIKYPKKTAPSRNGKPAFASLTVSFNAPNLDAAGFESDGINAEAIAAGKKTATVQLAIVLAGVPYLGTANVALKTVKKTNAVAIKLTK